MTIRSHSIVALVGLTLVAVSCSGYNSPSTPTAATTTLFSEHATLQLGDTEQVTATVVLSDGTRQTNPAGTWGSDNPTVATVGSTGLVTTVGLGDVTIFFDATSYSRGTKRFTVKNNL